MMTIIYYYSPSELLGYTHCYFDHNVALIVTGEFDRSKAERQEQKFGVKRIFIHPKFNRKEVAYDIALLQLNGAERRNVYVNPVRHFIVDAVYIVM